MDNSSEIFPLIVIVFMVIMMTVGNAKTWLNNMGVTINANIVTAHHQHVQNAQIQIETFQILAIAMINIMTMELAQIRFVYLAKSGVRLAHQVLHAHHVFLH
jgi:hypothetical protein